MIARCGICFREEVHDGDAVDVLVAGGHRRPADPAFASIYAMLAPAFAGDAAIVGRCAGCGAPMLADATGPAGAWDLETPGGTLQIVDGRPVGPSGPISREAADAFVAEQARLWRRGHFWKEFRRSPAILPVLALAIGIAAAWVWAASFFSAFVVNALTSGGGMRW